MKPVQRLLDIILFVAGPVLLLLGIFSFSYREVVGDNSIAVAYSYDQTALTLIAAGGALIALGALRRVWVRDSK